jgi:hypothetical protein
MLCTPQACAAAQKPGQRVVARVADIDQRLAAARLQARVLGWNCRMPGKYKDLIMDIATEQIGHVEMIPTMVARLLEGAPATATTKAAGADPVIGAVLGGMARSRPSWPAAGPCSRTATVTRGTAVTSWPAGTCWLTPAPT